MRQAETGKVKFVKDNTLIVAIDVGMEMNRGYCTTPDRRDIRPFNTCKLKNTYEYILTGINKEERNKK